MWSRPQGKSLLLYGIFPPGLLDFTYEICPKPSSSTSQYHFHPHSELSSDLPPLSADFEKHHSCMSIPEPGVLWFGQEASSPKAYLLKLTFLFFICFIGGQICTIFFEGVYFHHEFTPLQSQSQQMGDPGTQMFASFCESPSCTLCSPPRGWRSWDRCLAARGTGNARASLRSLKHNKKIQLFDLRKDCPSR